MLKAERISNILADAILKYNFLPPMTWVMVGIDGYIFAGRFELMAGNKVNLKVVTGRASELRFPINLMLIDKTGRVMHVVFKKPDEAIDLTNLRIEPQEGQA